MATEVDVAAELDMLAAATDRLLDTVRGWRFEELAAPSGLPRWSRAHVLTHLARNADGIRNLLLSARTGVPVPMYPSSALRAADIEAGAGRPASVVLEDLRAAAERFALDAGSLGPRDWAREVVVGSDPKLAIELIPHRLREVEAHHVDLAAGYTFVESPDDVLISFLDTVPSRFAGSALAPCTMVATDLDRRWRIGTGEGPQIGGPAAVLLAWATGRDSGGTLSCDRGAVPASPGWG